MKPLLILGLFSTGLSAQPDGAELFKQNCSACHLPEQQVVGPSLAEIRSLYLDKPQDLVKWALAPQKKRPESIEMPSMVHVGEPGLLAIHKYIMDISKDFVIKKPEANNTPTPPPAASREQRVQRIFMPNSGPAAIAVMLDSKTSLCWDAGSSRLRYAWTGGFIDGMPYWKGNGQGLARILGTVRYVEAISPFPGGQAPKFLGYELRSDLPVFRYRIANTDVSETFAALKGAEGFTRSFTVNPPPRAPLTLTFPSDQNVQLTSDKGTWSGSILTLPAANAAAFTITISLK